MKRGSANPAVLYLVDSVSNESVMSTLMFILYMQPHYVMLTAKPGKPGGDISSFQSDVLHVYGALVIVLIAQ